ncbi:MAG TPA: NAD(P)H-dependent oxidoreductase [Polyangia bacterium]|jgi:NAD(P)H-dependent FMN reductase|nr:NAD(P)H-dependent oxidoreductase [Polyangia bacterium]
MSDDTLRIGIILASTRQGRRGERYAKWIHEVAAQRPGLSVELVDLRDHRLPAYDAEAPPLVAEKSYVDPVARGWSELIAGLDGYIFVTPEYNHGYPGQLKNAIDHVQAGWWYKPAAFVSYGGASAGTRAVEQLRAVAAEVRMVSVRGEVNLRLMGLQTDEAGRPTDPYYAKQAAAMLDQLLWWGRVTKDGRAKVAPPV